MALTAERYAELTELCRRFRIDVLTAIHAAQSGHPGGSLSVCEILTYLYQEHMNLDASSPMIPTVTGSCSRRVTQRRCFTATSRKRASSPLRK